MDWLVGSISLVIGLIVGFFFARASKLYSVVVSACAGFLIGLLLNESVLYLVGSEILFWSVNIGLIILFGLMALVSFEQSVILATVLIGSYLAARGVSLFAGGYPNEFTLIE